MTPDPEGGVFCAATNSRILTITRQTGEADETCILPGSLISGKAGERNAVVECDESGQQWKRTALLKGSQVCRIEPAVEGRFPRVHEVLPKFSGPVLSLSIDPRFLLQAAEAMGYDDDTRAITLLVPIPRSENLLPPAVEVVTAIRQLIGEEDRYAAQRLWALAVNEDGSWEVGHFTDENRLHGEWGGGKWFVVVTYRPSGSFDPRVCADALVTTARTKFTNIGLNVDEPIALVNGKHNIGVIMPWAANAKVDKIPEYQATREAFIAALTGKPPIAMKPDAADPVPETHDTSESSIEQMSIDALQAQLTALLAQCA